MDKFDKIGELRLRIMELEAQVAALKDIAIKERATVLACSEYDPSTINAWLRSNAHYQLADEYPELFQQGDD